jgi:tRNA(fMet)-specific endonuclease VapC
MIVADTDVLIDYLAGVAPVAGKIAAYIEDETLQTTAITCFELLSEVRQGRRGDAVRELVRALNVLPLDRIAAECAATVRRQLDSSGLAIGMADSLIAGIALAHDAPLFTRNAKHFSRISELKLIRSSSD